MESLLLSVSVLVHFGFCPGGKNRRLNRNINGKTLIPSREKKFHFQYHRHHFFYQQNI